VLYSSDRVVSHERGHSVQSYRGLQTGNIKSTITCSYPRWHFFSVQVSKLVRPEKGLYTAVQKQQNHWKLPRYVSCTRNDTHSSSPEPRSTWGPKAVNDHIRWEVKTTNTPIKIIIVTINRDYLNKFVTHKDANFAFWTRSHFKIRKFTMKTYSWRPRKNHQCIFAVRKMWNRKGDNDNLVHTTVTLMAFHWMSIHQATLTYATVQRNLARLNHTTSDSFPV
jgi:hypothetical protein